MSKNYGDLFSVNSNSVISLQNAVLGSYQDYLEFWASDNTTEDNFHPLKEFRLYQPDFLWAMVDSKGVISRELISSLMSSHFIWYLEGEFFIAQHMITPAGGDNYARLWVTNYTPETVLEFFVGLGGVLMSNERGLVNLALARYGENYRNRKY